MSNENTNIQVQAHTPIQVATALGKAPQYIYGLLRNGKVPAEHIQQIPKGDGTMRELLLDSFFTWFESRGNSRPGRTAVAAVQTLQMTPEQLMDAMAVKLEALGDKKFKGLAEALRTASNFSVLPAGPEPAVEAQEPAATA